MAIKAPITSGSVPEEASELGISDALIKTAKYIKSLSLDSIEKEVVLLSCLLINTLSKKDYDGARHLAEALTEILTPKDSLFFRNLSNSELSKTELSKERWGLDPDLIKNNH